MKNRNITFRSLDGGTPSDSPGDVSPLERWYEAVRDVPVGEFADADLARALRQRLFPETLLPIALDRLSAEPLAGELYEGELFVALAQCGAVDLLKTYHQRTLSLLNQIELLSATEDVLAEASRLRAAM